MASTIWLMPNADESRGRFPGPSRLLFAATLLVLAALVLWTAVSYGTPSHGAASGGDGPTSTDTSQASGPSSPGLPPAPSISATSVAEASVSPVQAFVSGAPTAPSIVPAAKTPKNTVTFAAGATKPSATAKTPTAEPTFAPISLQAEDGTVTGGAEAISCAACEGGGRVRYIGGTGDVTVHGRATIAGRKTVTIFAETDGKRTLYVSINGASHVSLTMTGPSWVNPVSAEFHATIPGGPLSLRFFNTDGPAPDVDCVTVA